MGALRHGPPGPGDLLALAILLPLTIPFFSLQLGQEDIGATPKDTTERQAYDLLASGFGPGYNGPLLVAVSLGTPAKPSATFEKQYKKAQSLQAQLESEQRQGESLADSLENSADEIKARLAAIQAEKDALKARGGLGLRGEKRRLEPQLEAAAQAARGRQAATGRGQGCGRAWRSSEARWRPRHSSSRAS